ncbi:hypothetical protein [Jidongwangia harbinensis]|uniref:hypothetical protein n=1 Tax=Jidongwangia harbinensis TaxID=2878561 RepID=UPI001CD92500|nr:hypothetical protein [Jidongwangia harbinensis]MCA2215906.1 hypothetical protein [Jidongwangia harbinensis]
MRKKTMAGLGLAAAAAAGAVALGGAAFAGGDDAGSRPAQQVVNDQRSSGSPARDGGLVWPSAGSDTAAAAPGGSGKECPERDGSGSAQPGGPGAPETF